MGKIIGIDLGTTNSVVAIMEGSEVKVITNPSGFRTTPSVVGFKDNGERVIGVAAKNQAVTNPENTVYSIKRFMGRRRSEVKGEEKLVPYKIKGTADELVKVEIRGEAITPPEISAMVLAYLKQYAEDYIGEPVTEAVVTVPAYFNDAQRQATKDAGEIAGLKVSRIINEPTAAAVAYSLDKKVGQKILVFDLGGGTFDVSVLEVGDGVVEVKSTNGDTHLGGDDYDQTLIDFVSEAVKKSSRVDLRKDRLALQRLKETCEKAKCDLSQMSSTKVSIPFATAVDGVPIHVEVDVSKAQFQEITRHLTERCRGPVEQAMKDAKLEPKDIDEVVLVGGSTRMPAVQELVEKMFGKAPNKSVNPDEVVAIGAAIQGAILSGDKTDLLLLDVTPLSLGVETLGGVMNVMIQRNTTIPTTKKEMYTNAEDGQTKVDIKVFQGERAETAKCRHLNTFRLDGLPPAPRGGARVEVTFDIDANGILSITAKDVATGKHTKVVVQTSSGLTKDEVARMKQEAEQYGEEDAKRRELIEVRNKADTMLFQGDRMLRSAPIGEEAKKALQAKVDALRTARNGEDIPAIEAAMQGIFQAQETAPTNGVAAQAEADDACTAGDEAETVDTSAEATS